MTPKEALEEAVRIVGSQSRLAKEIGNGITQSHINYWLRKAPVVPAEHCPAIEHIVKKAVTCEQLNPRVSWWVLRRVN